MLLGSNLNMKTKREHRNTNANVAQRRLIERRFAKRTHFAVVVRVHLKTRN
jgi:hypothetical protein